MSNQLDKNVRDILLFEWDPIGIGDMEEAQDEYDLYVDKIVAKLNSSATESDIFKYLWDVENDSMGLPGNQAHTRSIALKLISLRGT